MNEGYYDGVVVSLAPVLYQGKVSRVSGVVEVAGEKVTVTNWVDGQYPEANEQSIEAIKELGVEWPDGLVDMQQTTQGKTCRVRVMKNGKARLITSGGAASFKPPTEAEIREAIARMKGGDDEPPF